jgi:hypothetical protein
MEVNEVVYCKKTGSPFRIKRSCILNSITHFELERISNRETGKKLLAETSVKLSFQTDRVERTKSHFTRFTELLKA